MQTVLHTIGFEGRRDVLSADKTVSRGREQFGATAQIDL